MQGSAKLADTVGTVTHQEESEAVDIGMANLSVEAQTSDSSEALASQPRRHDTGGEESGSGMGYVGRLKVAVLDCVDSSNRAPETLEEALAVIKGERAVKPDYERAFSTMSAAFAGGCAHGWWHGAAVAAKFPPHQRSSVRVRAGTAKGLRFAFFALIFEGSSAIMEALRRKKDFVGGTVGGAMAGMAYGVTGGVAAARRGLFYGVWLGGVFGLCSNHVSSLRQQTQMKEEDERLAQEERDAIGRSALARSIEGLEAQLATWPTAEDESEPKAS
eukprot:g7726.t1